jgi:hypothetical protein
MHEIKVRDRIRKSSERLFGLETSTVTHNEGARYCKRHTNDV